MDTRPASRTSLVSAPVRTKRTVPSGFVSAQLQMGSRACQSEIALNMGKVPILRLVSLFTHQVWFLRTDLFLNRATDVDRLLG